MSTGRKWLTGCGIGCGVLVLIAVVLAGGGFLVFKDVIGDFRAVERTDKALVEQFGEPTDFVPRWDGTIPAGRIETFLAVRDTLRPVREQLAQSLGEDLPALEGGEVHGLEKIIRGIRTGASLGGDIAAFLNVRNQVLLERGMAPGEYAYLYVLTYYSWLGYDPGAGPAGVKVDSGRGGGVHWEVGSEEGDWNDPESRARTVRRLANRLLRPVLENQLAAAPDQLAAADAAWLEDLAAEIALLHEDRRRIPWQDGLPGRVATSLAPWREPLAAGWSPVSNVLELNTLED